jgi:hypothetical protein
MTPSPTATEGVAPNKATPVATHAYVDNGQLCVLEGGRLAPMTRWGAVAILAELDGSPFPSSQERARQIRAALKETTQ